MPDTVELFGDDEDMEEAYYVYAVLEATGGEMGWTWTPLDVLSQPAKLMHNVLTLSGLDSKIKRIIEDAKRGKV